MLPLMAASAGMGLVGNIMGAFGKKQKAPDITRSPYWTAYQNQGNQYQQALERYAQGLSGQAQNMPGVVEAPDMNAWYRGAETRFDKSRRQLRSDLDRQYQRTAAMRGLGSGVCNYAAAPLAGYNQQAAETLGNMDYQRIRQGYGDQRQQRNDEWNRWGQQNQLMSMQLAPAEQSRRMAMENMQLATTGNPAWANQSSGSNLMGMLSGVASGLGGVGQSIAGGMNTNAFWDKISPFLGGSPAGSGQKSMTPGVQVNPWQEQADERNYATQQNMFNQDLPGY